MLSVVRIILVEIHRTSLFSQKKKLKISETRTKYPESLFFLRYLKGANLEENLDLFKQLFLIKPVKVAKD